MKIPFLSRLFPSRASPKNSFWSSPYSFFFGASSSGKSVSEITALQTTAVYACVRILAETIASYEAAEKKRSGRLRFAQQVKAMWQGKMRHTRTVIR